ncbi:hypothetical protein GCM10023340_30890 [Nocardioides marinquilinus]|uniref:Histidine kinase/HSP90-like ATPase domain-containing protein n=1 Tax=Nocardioides marinquilinus TaxID=1210400 RepID=A0ABP9PT27_9ACTN
MGDTHAGRPVVPDEGYDPLGRAVESDDPRVAAVLDVLAGAARADVARRLAVDEARLAQWVGAFVEAGAARLAERSAGTRARRHDRFLSTFMHALRAQLAMAQMWVELLGDAATPSADVAGHLQDALGRLDATAHDVELITAALLGRLRPAPRAVGLPALVAGLSPAPTLDAATAGVRLVVDPALFARVLRDLWQTAHTVGPRPEGVGLEADAGERWVELRVVRTGPPVDEAVLAAVFEPFDRESDDASVTVGLYLARALAAVHDATVVVRQERVRTVLAVRVPTGRASAG